MCNGIYFKGGEGGSVPWLVTACVKHLETYGLHTTGIFRVSTSLKRIRQVRSRFCINHNFLVIKFVRFVREFLYLHLYSIPSGLIF